MTAAGTGQLFFEDLMPGLRVIGRPHVLTEADFRAFAATTGDAHPIHYDAIYAARTRFGRCVAHGLLLVGLTALGASPLSARLHDFMIALVGQETRFVAPAFAGDALVATHEVATLRRSAGRECGHVRFAVALLRGGEIILDGHHDYLIKTRAEAAA